MAVTLPPIWQRRFQILFGNQNMIDDLVNAWNRRGLKPTLQHVFRRANSNNINDNEFLTYLTQDKDLIGRMIKVLESEGIGYDAPMVGEYPNLYRDIMAGKYSQPTSVPSVVSPTISGIRPTPAITPPMMMPPVTSAITPSTMSTSRPGITMTSSVLVAPITRPVSPPKLFPTPLTSQFAPSPTAMAPRSYAPRIRTTSRTVVMPEQFLEMGEIRLPSAAPALSDDKTSNFIAQEVTKTERLRSPENPRNWGIYEGDITRYFSLPGTLAEFKEIWAKVAANSDDYPMDVIYVANGWHNGTDLASYFRARAFKTQLLQLMYVFNMIPPQMTKEELGRIAYASSQNYTALLLRAGIKMGKIAVPGVMQKQLEVPAAPNQEHTFDDSIFYNGVEIPENVTNEHNATAYERKCVICNQRAAIMVFIPCTHQVCCFTDALGVVDTSQRCPICDKKIRAMIDPKIF